MEDSPGRNVVRQSSSALRLLRSTPPSTPPSFTKFNSTRSTPRSTSAPPTRNTLLLWLLLIALWAYLAFYVQSNWAHSHNHTTSLPHFLLLNNASFSTTANTTTTNLHKLDAPASSKPSTTLPRRHRARKRANHKVAPAAYDQDGTSDYDIPKRNTSHRLIFGPFASAEDRILGRSAERRSGACDRSGDFARLVRSRNYVLIFHELSITGAPLSMMELATELMSCGATVSAVLLSKKGGLMQEITRRKIKVLEDKEKISFRAAMKADLVIAGSAVCATWIEQYHEHFPAGSSQIAWWIMENRREYFNRSKLMLNRVKMLIFLTESQSKQWLAWCQEEGIKLYTPPALIPLSVHDELAFVAGIPCSLNTPSFTVDEMLRRRQLLRDAVRKEMGLVGNDMLVMSLSSINPGKGQRLLLESARLTVEPNHFSDNERTQKQALKILVGSVGSKSNKVFYVKGLVQFLSQHSELSKAVLWTRATTHVASLYSAADVYVINSQGLGETFGRVTIEAMAYGLPVLGTDAGGTKEIVEHNITGLLHPLGRRGIETLAKNLLFFLKNPAERNQMGMRGRKKVEKIYLKHLMYKKFTEVISKCMRPK